MSHGAQKMNGIMQDIGRGAHRLVAARYTFRRLFLAGLTALLADAVGFAVLMVIDIPVIQDLALTASIGVAVLIFTNLILLPVLLTYVGVSDGGRAQPARRERGSTRPRRSTACWRCSTASPSGAGRSARSPRRPCCSRRRLRGRAAAARSATSTRARRSCAPTRATTATTPTSPATTRCRSDTFAVIVKTEQGRLPELPDAGRGRPPGVGAAAGARRADHGVAGRRGAPDHRRQLRGQPQVADASPATRTC